MDIIIHPAVEQGSPEWFSLRQGKLTASVASKLLTATGRLSTQFKSEMGRILAETLELQEPEPIIPNKWMVRGTEMEAEARKWFTVVTDLDVNQVGFIESSDHILGASPDGIVEVEHDGKVVNVPLELKVPKPSTHIDWLLNSKDSVPACHMQQVHFTIALMDAPFGYFQSYNESVEPLIVKVERDKYTEKMADAMDVYVKEFKWAYELITGEPYHA